MKLENYRIYAKKKNQTRMAHQTFVCIFRELTVTIYFLPQNRKQQRSKFTEFLITHTACTQYGFQRDINEFLVLDDSISIF